MSLTYLETTCAADTSAIRKRLREDWGHRLYVLFHRSVDALVRVCMD